MHLLHHLETLFSSSLVFLRTVSFLFSFPPFMTSHIWSNDALPVFCQIARVFKIPNIIQTQEKMVLFCQHLLFHTANEDSCTREPEADQHHSSGRLAPTFFGYSFSPFLFPFFIFFQLNLVKSIFWFAAKRTKAQMGTSI